MRKNVIWGPGLKCHLPWYSSQPDLPYHFGSSKNSWPRNSQTFSKSAHPIGNPTRKVPKLRESWDFKKVHLEDPLFCLSSDLDMPYGFGITRTARFRKGMASRHWTWGKEKHVYFWLNLRILSTISGFCELFSALGAQRSHFSTANCWRWPISIWMCPFCCFQKGAARQSGPRNHWSISKINIKILLKKFFSRFLELQ